MPATYPGIESSNVISPRDDGLLAAFKAFLAGHRNGARLTAPDGVTVELPEEVREVIVQAVDALANGSAVTVAPVSARLTTTQAAEILGVSRPTLIKMLEDGKIPYEQLNVHRALRLSDVLAFKETRRAEQRAILDEMTRQAVEDGLYDDSYADYAQALEDARHNQSR